MYSLRLRTRGHGFFLGFGGILGVCFLTLPALVSEPWLGIVFTSFVRSEKDQWANVDVLAAKIKELTGIDTVGYHGQLSSRERRKIEQYCIKDY